MELLANKVYIQGMEVLLADKVHKQEPQRINGYFHTTIPTCVAVAWQMPRVLSFLLLLM